MQCNWSCNWVACSAIGNGDEALPWFSGVVGSVTVLFVGNSTTPSPKEAYFFF